MINRGRLKSRLSTARRHLNIIRDYKANARMPYHIGELHNGSKLLARDRMSLLIRVLLPPSTQKTGWKQNKSLNIPGKR
ncbi:hypothetical protein NPIL_702491 [Nephila pilipes]|uniref:Uncharacterized protein n=1 Tax=Nephila pilipes TaxID=299642 RepID=A0A8X6THW5_NEPPI|nr:hypothetical protein NPIL_702491 [Nephila pilipes]